jgi:hypothetical protein
MKRQNVQQLSILYWEPAKLTKSILNIGWPMYSTGYRIAKRLTFPCTSPNAYIIVASRKGVKTIYTLTFKLLYCIVQATLTATGNTDCEISSFITDNEPLITKPWWQKWK